MIKKGAGHKADEASEFVKDKLRAAEWLIKSIQNRQKTIEKVSKAIVSKQQDFFKKGPKYLKPMVLKDVANEIGMHESTVSRVTTNKYMHTPLGTFELKYFFNTGIGGKDGGVDIASEVLKLKIKAIFEGENTQKPFSDQKVVEILARENLTVARRTVTKYREMLGIDPSSKRKEKN
jgi:RNA polymerase sigma-54 factor